VLRQPSDLTILTDDAGYALEVHGEMRRLSSLFAPTCGY
jgi:hypothetical protein